MDGMRRHAFVCLLLFACFCLPAFFGHDAMPLAPQQPSGSKGQITSQKFYFNVVFIEKYYAI